MSPSSSIRTPGAGSPVLGGSGPRTRARRAAPPRPRAGRRRPRARRAPRRCRCSPCWPRAPFVVITNSPASASYVATVPSACTLEPWPVSVIAKQPISFPVTRSGRYVVVVPRGAELEDRAAEQPELDADLDQHRQVAEGQGLEGRERRPDVTAAAVLLREAHAGLAGRGHLEHDLLDPLAERRPVEGLGLLEDRGVLDQVGAHQLPHLGVVAVEQRGQRRDVDRRLDVAGRLGLGASVGCGESSSGCSSAGAVVSVATARGYPAAARARGADRREAARSRRDRPSASASERAPRSASVPQRCDRRSPRSGRAKRASPSRVLGRSSRG